MSFYKLLVISKFLYENRILYSAYHVVKSIFSISLIDHWCIGLSIIYNPLTLTIMIARNTYHFFSWDAICYQFA